MGSSRRRSATPLGLTALFVVLLCVFPAIALASSWSPTRDDTDSKENELICHTSNPDECYPKIFQATDEFRTVHKDQEVPKGLHIRMNMTSGEMEAKINVDGELPAELESSGGLAKDQSVMVVEPEAPEQPKIPKGAPAYESVGKIKEPENNAAFFYDALQIVKESRGKSTDGLDQALESLEDISHDLYYGLKITEDTSAVHALFCMMVGTGEESPDGVTPREQQAAAILAGALSNNPTALSEVSAEWPSLKATECPNGQPMGELLYKSFAEASESAGGNTVAAAKAKAKVGAFNGLIKGGFIRQDFLGNGGMKLLLEVLLQEGDGWAAAKRKTGQLVLDNFLDADMGAVLGQFPRAALLSDAECQTPETQTEEGCWEYHVGRIAQANKKDKDHWSQDLNRRFSALRKDTKGDRGHVEL